MNSSHHQPVALRGLIAYTLTFPTSLDAGQVQAIAHVVGGRLYGAPPVAFEVWLTEASFTYRLRVPPWEAEFITAQVRTLIPGIKVLPEQHQPSHVWSDVLEFGD